MGKKKTAATKVTAEELKNIQDRVSDINRLQMNIGGLEVQKSVAVRTLSETQGSLAAIQRDLELKYGKVSVNLDDGSLKPIIDEQLSKED